LRLLLVDDDPGLVENLRPILKRAGYAVEVSDNGVDAAFFAREEDFDAVILDLGLPGKPGLEVLREWRDEGMDAPVLVLTARDAWHERVDGLKAGADDYLGKPFHGAELLARLEAILRRRAGRSDNTLEASGVTLDIDRQQATGPDGDIHQLTGIEFRLLRCLMTNADRILPKTELSEHVYEEEHLKDSNVIEVYINRLRNKFGHDFIETRRGQGYRLRTGV
jgi:two-component system OmpR family response regulator